MELNENKKEEIVPSTKFNLQTIDENFRMDINCILETKEPKGIHSVKFNYNYQYIAAVTEMVMCVFLIWWLSSSNEIKFKAEQTTF